MTNQYRKWQQSKSFLEQLKQTHLIHIFNVKWTFGGEIVGANQYAPVWNYYVIIHDHSKAGIQNSGK